MKIKNISGILAISAAFMMLMPSCKKYEDGPLVQLSSRAERVANTWVVEEATANGEDITEDFEEYELYFTVDGDAELSAEYELFSVQYTTDTNGTWELQNDDENLDLNFEGEEDDRTYQILRLTKDELWLREIGEDIELKLEEK